MEQNGRSCGVSPVFSCELGTEYAINIFEEAELGLHEGDLPDEERPEVAGVFISETLAGCGKSLAGKPACKDAHFAAKRESREGFKIRPDRCRVQESRFHFCDQIRGCEGFDLTKSDDAQIWDCSTKSEMDACVACTEFHDING
jgi:hypothetical protein